MKVLLSLAVFVSVIGRCTAKDGLPTAAGAPQSPSMSLRELLNAYQRLYERQFHEPLPESQKALLAALPRFNAASTLKAQRSSELSKAFQQDGDSKTLEGKEVSTAQVQKREITTKASPMTPMGTTPEKMEQSSSPSLSTLTSMGSTSQTDATATAKPIVAPVQGRKLADLHPEMKQMMEGKMKPTALKEVMASPMITEMPARTIPTQTQENPAEQQPSVSSKPFMTTNENPMTPVSKAEAGTTQAQDTEVTMKARPNLASPAPQPAANSIPLTKANMRAETKPRLPPAKTSKADLQQKARKVAPARKNAPVAKPRNMKPLPRQLQRQQPNLKVLNHVVVPRTQATHARGPAARKAQVERGRNVQLRRPQPLRRASAPSVRQLPSAAVEGAQQQKAAARGSSLIVIRDGRIMELTEQQQRDLNMILSAMGASGKEASSRRRAPPRRGRITPSRQQLGHVVQL
ncbi:hypothetical protein RB195_019703 [Necator americanus]|uniref:Uncharacterized protein n=1 Tax=Necator americanus TaxID=51031 RepID=A0ABR1CFE5_NECAM